MLWDYFVVDFGTQGWNRLWLLEVEFVSHPTKNLEEENAQRIVCSRDLACESSVEINESVIETSHSCDSLAENMTVSGLCHENLYEAE